MSIIDPIIFKQFIKSPLVDMIKYITPQMFIGYGVNFHNYNYFKIIANTPELSVLTICDLLNMFKFDNECIMRRCVCTISDNMNIALYLRGTVCDYDRFMHMTPDVNEIILESEHMQTEYFIEMLVWYRPDLIKYMIHNNICYIKDRKALLAKKNKKINNLKRSFRY